MRAITSPLDITCRYCYATAGEACTTKAEPTSRFVRVLRYTHSIRWADFTAHQNKIAALSDWQKLYGRPISFVSKHDAHLGAVTD